MTEQPYQIIIGLEVHVQLLTRTKLFCGCPTTFGLPPNSATCPVCLGLPGVLPVMNRRAFDLALRAGMALNCRISTTTRWDRKNYYYPDLPKNYQISQLDLPFSEDGWLEIETSDGPRKIGIIRAHLEEDAGKLIHDDNGKISLVDLNRTGTPLLEIVSQPEIRSPEEAKSYLENIRLLMRDLEISDCEMQEGSLRCDANINLHITQSEGKIIATPIVEVKNLNSFRAVEKAMRYEAERQYQDFLETGQTIKDVPKTTAGWDDVRGVTVIQRRKEEAADYRYFPEPDLMPVVVDEQWRESVQENLGELPQVARHRYETELGLSAYDAGVLTQQGRPFRQYFEDALAVCGDAKEASNWLTNQVQTILNEKKITIDQFALSAAALGSLIATTKKTGLNKKRAAEVFAYMLENGTSADESIRKLEFTPVSDEEQLLILVRKAIEANPKAVADFQAGKTKAADALKGFVMKETRGMANMEVVQKLLFAELAIS